MSNQNETLVRRFYREVLGQGEVGLVDELFAPDYLEHRDSGSVVYTNLSVAKAWFKEIEEAFPNRMVVLEDVRSFDDAVVSRWSLSAAHTRSFKGIPPTGRTIDVAGTTIFRVNDNSKISEGWNVSDSKVIVEQLEADTAPDPWVSEYLEACISSSP